MTVIYPPQRLCVLVLVLVVFVVGFVVMTLMGLGGIGVVVLMLVLFVLVNLRGGRFQENSCVNAVIMYTLYCYTII